MKKFAVGFLTILLLSSCGSFGKKLKAFMGGDAAAEPSSTQSARSRARYSQAQNVNSADQNRRYRRMTKELFEKEGLTQEKSGSLWVMEGQGSYLFADNQARLVGDIVNVQLEGSPKKELDVKVDVIKKLSYRAKRAAKQAAQAATIQSGQPGAAASPAPQGKDAQRAPAGTNPATAAATEPQEEEDEDGGFALDFVPSRVVEREADGSYRIKGSRIFMIGKKEYKVVVIGLVRPGDVDGDRVPASKILDGRFDIVTNKKEVR